MGLVVIMDVAGLLSLRWSNSLFTSDFVMFGELISPWNKNSQKTIRKLLKMWNLWYAFATCRDLTSWLVLVNHNFGTFNIYFCPWLKSNNLFAHPSDKAVPAICRILTHTPQLKNTHSHTWSRIKRWQPWSVMRIFFLPLDPNSESTNLHKVRHVEFV